MPGTSFSGGRSSSVNYATAAMYDRIFSNFQNYSNRQRSAAALAIAYQANTGAGGGSLKRTFKSIPLFGFTQGIKLQFSINGLRQYAYQHAPVKSMATTARAPLEEIITTQPLKNLYDRDSTHIFYLTYIYYKTEDESGTPILNGYGYLTCNFFQDTSVRGIFTVTDFTTRILSGDLFGVGNGSLDGKFNGKHSENVYLMNNNNGEKIQLLLSIDNDIVTIETPM